MSRRIESFPTGRLVMLVEAVRAPRGKLLSIGSKMNTLIRNMLAPLASAATGAIIAILVAIFLFGIRDRDILRAFALIGALIRAAPDVMRTVAELTTAERGLRSSLLDEPVPPYIVGEEGRQEEIQRNKIAQEQEARKKLLAAEHEARRPICTHCGNKTEGVYRHRRINGGPDRRYLDNPLLCNKCFKPYAGIRPWNLPRSESK
jgi:hypothetical protein